MPPAIPLRKSARPWGSVTAEPGRAITSKAGKGMTKTREPEEAQATTPEQVPLARVSGKPLVDMPKDLYIPPDALAVFLEAFEGPLDLLLYLIRRQNMNILDIDVSEITRQYMDYIGAVEAMRFELAAEYLVMAATLAEIKSRMLLPRQESDDEDDIDPRAELIRRLQQYERFKQAAEDIDEIPRMERDTFAGSAALPKLPSSQPHPDVDMKELLLALRGVLQRADLFTSHHVEKERLSTRERMSHILSASGRPVRNLREPVYHRRRPAWRGGDLSGHAGTGQGTAD